MPTENRSSNTEMVSVPTLLAADSDRDMLEYLAEAVDTQTYVCDQCGHEEPLSTFDIASDLRDYMLAFPQAPAPKPHPEPIAWMVGTAFWWQKPGAERDSEERGEPMVPLGPCDSPSEIARLTAQFKDWQASHHRNYCKAADERDELRGQLEQARRLLHTASIRLANWLEPDDDPRKQIIAFLEGAIEPSTLAARYPNRLCHIDYTAHPHRCGCLKGDDEAQRRYDEHFRGASAEPEAT